MDVLLITSDGAEHRTVDELDVLLDKARSGTGVVWVDVPAWDEAAAAALVDRFGLHPRAVGDCVHRNAVPKVHLYSDHVFVVLHAPERGARGHVHFVELDQFVGVGWIITVHGPLNPQVPPESAVVESSAVARRLTGGRLRPTAAHEVSYALVSAMVGRMNEYLTALTEESWALERKVTAGHFGGIENFLEQLFQVRHGLLSVRTIAAMSGEVYGRIGKLPQVSDRAHPLVLDLEDQFHRLAQMSEAQRRYLQGVIEFYQARTNTRMTVATERLAVIAAVTLPVTAISSIVGMNVVVYESTHVGLLVVLLTTMTVLSVIMLLWARRQGWW